MTVIAPSYPDLVITALTTNATSYTVEDGITISATVKNQGNASSGAFYTSLTGSNGASAKAYCSGLNVGAFTTLTWKWTAPASPCTLTLTGYADCDGNVQESNENNNTATTSVSVIARKYPDLTVTSVTPEQPSYTAGSTRYEEVIPMPGNGSNLAVFRIKLPAATGSASLAFTVDPYNAVPEDNESNNDLSKTVRIIAVPVGIVLDPDLPELEQTYKTRGLLSIPNATNSDYHIWHIWQEVRYESGSYVTRTYWARLQTVFSLVPDPRIAYPAEPKRMESGFGVQVALRTQLTTNYDHPEKLVGVQMAWVYSPEAGYGQYPLWSGVFDSLETSGGTPGDKVVSWRYRCGSRTVSTRCCPRRSTHGRPRGRCTGTTPGAWTFWAICMTG